MSSPSKPRAFAAFVKPDGLDATRMANTGKALMRTLKTLTAYTDFVTWKVNFMQALWYLDANAVHIAEGTLTPLHKIKDDGSGEQEEVDEGALPKHVVVYDYSNDVLYAFLFAYLDASIQRALGSAVKRGDGHALWELLKKRAASTSEVFRAQKKSEEER